MKLLHIIASPRHGESNTLKASEAFITGLRDHRPDVTVEVIDLYDHDLPSMEGGNIEAKYDLLVGRPIDPGHAEAWSHVESLIAHFQAADAYLITAPMWNLSIPYALKYYIDCIVQPGYTFRYGSTGYPEPMVLGKKLVVASTRGSDYSAGGPMHSYDFMEPYLRAIFGFIGITDVTFVCGQPMHGSPEQREAALAVAVEQARDLAAGPEWADFAVDQVAAVGAA
ncbi:FMN-dependent NADH-azoreductase [Cellulomonas sp. URHD0024]|uniref:FMN-dependent NADH-azoreductase n=1 Tax=Cellulomonas sp. URHD0024 TaxID=1302620 RepID=UPI00040B1DD0|nr:NAD(P)H-dependent oxidoreductase [Cellulomonas sp. URHD0024]